jgi:hypothetical protein
MEPKKGEHGKDQQFHRQMDVIQERECLGVFVIGMGLEVAEVRYRTGMAFPARGQPVFADRERRLRIVDRQDIVRPVAVAAFRSRLVAQLGQRPVQTHPLALGQLLVTVTAAIGQSEPEAIGLGIRHVVAVVAVRTTRRAPLVASWRRFFRDPTWPAAAETVDALSETFFDEPVTLRAGGSHVGRV